MIMSKQQKQQPTVKQVLLEKVQRLESRIAELEALKSKEGAAFTEELADELDNCVMELGAATDEIDKIELAEFREAAAAKKEGIKKEVFIPEVVDSKLYHVMLRTGKPKYSSTGEDISPKQIQKFTVAEFKHFKQHAERLGYRMEVLFDPTKTV